MADFQNVLDAQCCTEEDAFPLLTACSTGNTAKVELLLANNSPINLQNNHGYTALSEASYQGHSRIVRCLLDHGADYKIVTKRNCTPMYLAAIRGHKDIIKLLFEYGADVDPINNNGDSPLIACCSMKAVEMKDRGGPTPYIDSVALLLSHKADVNIASKTGHTALLLASLNGHVDIVQLLLDHKADVNAVDFLGQSSLHSATANGHFRVVRLLLSRGADAALKDKIFLKTALHFAYERLRFETVLELLLTSGGQNTALELDREGRTPPELLGQEHRSAFSARVLQALSYHRRRMALFVSTRAVDANGRNSTIFKKLHDSQLGPWRMAVLYL